jgi:hypothetical protein
VRDWQTARRQRAVAAAVAAVAAVEGDGDEVALGMGGRRQVATVESAHVEGVDAALEVSTAALGEVS